jgi:hypothetical protein
LLCDSGNVKSEKEEKICEVAVMRQERRRAATTYFLQHFFGREISGAIARCSKSSAVSRHRNVRTLIARRECTAGCAAFRKRTAALIHRA